MPAGGEHLRSRYLDLLKRALTNYLYLGEEQGFARWSSTDHYDKAASAWRIGPESRPATLLNQGQLDLLERCVLDLEARGIAGDYIEAGIWRGGAVAFLRGLLDAHGIAERKIYGADSFDGIPKNTKFAHDPVDRWTDRWSASRPEVEGLLRRFGLLDERVVLVEGLFADTLPALAGHCFALVRLDSDSYDSVMTSLELLYPGLAPGGIVVIDDWHLPGCRFAVDAYRAAEGIDAPIAVDAGNGWWIKPGA